MPEEKKLIGKITHYFPQVEVAIIKLNSNLRIGDQVKLKKGDEEFEQEALSMQSEHKNVKEAKKGEEVGLKVNQKVREGWEIYK